ncbi:DsbA family oxidoreductase [Aliibacillus thermotolerans]|uniref:DsbA family oxidoreductase n=1 Tax=Aliibacillus thermotolerans TaxID=1834418 RepID=A0ABW0U9Y9_9BACI|nr:DsbA family oxidoreductase [Aliibacillus thermotolerans]
MKIEVWSDIVCPFCYIGKRRLDQALEKWENKEEVEVEFKSFQLDPNATRGERGSIHQQLATKYNMPVAQAKGMNSQVAEQAKQVGLDYDFDQVIPANTAASHQLSQYAKTEGKMVEVMELLMKAYFIEGKDVSDTDTLVEIGKEAGLDPKKVRKALESDAYKSDVVRDQQDGSTIGVQGVPFFLFNRKFAVSGAQPEEAFLQALDKAVSES